MPHYVDGFVLPIPKDKIALYREIAEEAGKIWREHGALEYRECVGDDLDVKDQVPFPRIIESKPDETVVFAWIVFESREHRDEVNAKVMADPRLLFCVALAWIVALGGCATERSEKCGAALTWIKDGIENRCSLSCGPSPWPAQPAAERGGRLPASG